MSETTTNSADTTTTPSTTHGHQRRRNGRRSADPLLRGAPVPPPKRGSVSGTDVLTDRSHGRVRKSPRSPSEEFSQRAQEPVVLGIGADGHPQRPVTAQGGARP